MPLTDGRWPTDPGDDYGARPGMGIVLVLLASVVCWGLACGLLYVTIQEWLK